MRFGRSLLLSVFIIAFISFFFAFSCFFVSLGASLCLAACAGPSPFGSNLTASSSNFKASSLLPEAASKFSAWRVRIVDLTSSAP